MASEHAIIRSCEEAGTLFEDPHFAPPEGERWLRPREIFGSSASLFADGIALGSGSAVTIGEGRLGDGWLLGALATIAARPALLNHLFISVRGMQYGIYTVQLFIGDSWAPVTVDDRLPCSAAGEPLYARSSRRGELWVSIVEKAWAKLMGGYQALRLGHMPTALRALTGGLPIAVPLASASPSASELSSSTAELTWDRLRRLIATGAPMALVRRSPPAGLDAVERAEVLHGLSYPLVRSRSVHGTQEVLVSSPWQGGDSGLAALSPSAPAEDHGRWVPFAALPRLFDVLHVAASPAIDQAAAAADGSGGAAEMATASTRLGVSGSWPKAARAHEAPPAPAYVLSVHRPVELMAMLEQHLAPRATPPARSGLALLLVDMPRPSGGGGRTVLAHTLPARPHRRVLLDVATLVQPGEYLLFPHRSAPAGAPAASFRIEVDTSYDGSGGRAGAAATLVGLPGGLANGGADLIEDLGEEVASLLAGMAPSTERLEDGREMLSQLDQIASDAERERAASKLQARIRGCAPWPRSASPRLAPAVHLTAAHRNLVQSRCHGLRACLAAGRRRRRSRDPLPPFAPQVRAASRSRGACRAASHAQGRDGRRGSHRPGRDTRQARPIRRGSDGSHLRRGRRGTRLGRARRAGPTRDRRGHAGRRLGAGSDGGRRGGGGAPWRARQRRQPALAS